MTEAPVHLLERQLEEFAAAVAGTAPRTLAGAADGVPVVASIEAARRSAREGSSWCPLPTWPGVNTTLNVGPGSSSAWSRSCVGNSTMVCGSGPA